MAKQDERVARINNTEFLILFTRLLSLFILLLIEAPATYDLLSRRVSSRLWFLARRLPSYGALLAFFNAPTHKLIEPLIALFFLARFQALNPRQQRTRY